MSPLPSFLSPASTRPTLNLWSQRSPQRYQKAHPFPKWLTHPFTRFSSHTSVPLSANPLVCHLHGKGPAIRIKPEYLPTLTSTYRLPSERWSSECTSLIHQASLSSRRPLPITSPLQETPCIRSVAPAAPQWAPEIVLKPIYTVFFLYTQTYDKV